MTEISPEDRALALEQLDAGLSQTGPYLGAALVSEAGTWMSCAQEATEPEQCQLLRDLAQAFRDLADSLDTQATEREFAMNTAWTPPRR